MNTRIHGYLWLVRSCCAGELTNWEDRIAVTVTKDPTIVTVLWACPRKYHQFVLLFLEVSVTKSRQYSCEFPKSHTH